MSRDENFLSRWSRRKRDSRRAEPGHPPEAPERMRDEAEGAAPGEVRAPAARPSPQAPETRLERRVPPGQPSRAPEGALPSHTSGGALPVDGQSEPVSERDPGGADADASSVPELPPIDSLTPESDFRAFMRAGVDGATRNAALARLFSDPHFNVMDGLDVYIDDYNKTEPIPPTMLARLEQLHTIGLSDEEIERRLADGAQALLAQATGSPAPIPGGSAEPVPGGSPEPQPAAALGEAGPTTPAPRPPLADDEQRPDDQENSQESDR